LVIGIVGVVGFVASGALSLQKLGFLASLYPRLMCPLKNEKTVKKKISTALAFLSFRVIYLFSSVPFYGLNGALGYAGAYGEVCNPLEAMSGHPLCQRTS